MKQTHQHGGEHSTLRFQTPISQESNESAGKVTLCHFMLERTKYSDKTKT